MARATSHEERVRAYERAQRMLETKLTDLKRLTTSIHRWQRRVHYYAAQMALTDEQRVMRQAIARERREAQARRRGGRRIRV